MNKIMLVGRLTDDPDTKEVSKDSLVTRFSVAVKRSYKNSEGEYEADFINCVAFGGQAELIDDWCTKGMLVSIVGHIQTGSYEDSEGIKRKSFDCVIEQLQFLESKKEVSKDEETEPKTREKKYRK